MVGIVRVSIPLPGGANGYAYVAVDHDRRHQEWRKYAQDAINDGTDVEERRDKTYSQGFFVLLCSEMITPTEILPLCYTRQAVEQIFDMSKNDIDLLPLRVHSENTLRAHLMLVFLASLVYLFLNENLKATKFNATNALLLFRNLKCKVYANAILVKEPVKKMNDIANSLHISFPKVIVEGNHYGN